jgi:hypothetical protein
LNEVDDVLARALVEPQAASRAFGEVPLVSLAGLNDELSGDLLTGKDILYILLSDCHGLPLRAKRLSLVGPAFLG